MSENYEKVKLLGEGAFGKAFLAKCFATKSHVVLKEINLMRMTAKERREAKREVEILSQLEHCCIVTYHNSYETPKSLVIVMEYCDNGDLQHKLMSRQNNLLSEDQILNWFVQICLALKHLHDRKILHRDLKSQNVFLTKSGLTKLGDFGIAKVLNNTTELALTQAGTPYYLSPEICDARPYNNKSDIWSMGCILYEMCSLKHPFNGKTIMDLLRNIKRASYKPLPRYFSADLQELLSKLLKKHPQDRPDINSVLRHPIIWKKIGEYLSREDYEKEFSHTVLHGLKISKSSQPVESSKKHGKAGRSREAPKLEINNKGNNESNRIGRKNVEGHNSDRDPCLQKKPKCNNDKVQANNCHKAEIKKQFVEIPMIPKQPLQKGNVKNDFLRRRNEYAEKLRQIRLQNLRKKFNPKECNVKAANKLNRHLKNAHQRNKKDFDESYQRAVKEVEALGRICSAKRIKKKTATKKTNPIPDHHARGSRAIKERRNSARSENARVDSAKTGSGKRKSLPDIKETPRCKEVIRKQWNIPQGSKVSKLVAVEAKEIRAESGSMVQKNEAIATCYEVEEVKELLLTGKLDTMDPMLLRTCSEPDLLNVKGLQSDEEDDSTLIEHKSILFSVKESVDEMTSLRSKSTSDLTSPNFKNSSGKELAISSESSCSESNDELNSVRESMVSCLTFTPLSDFERELGSIRELPEGCKRLNEKSVKCAWEGTEFGLQRLQSTILKTIKCFSEEGHREDDYFEEISEVSS